MEHLLSRELYVVTDLAARRGSRMTRVVGCDVVRR